MTAEQASPAGQNDPPARGLFPVEPRPGGTGWFFSVYQRIGRAKIANRGGYNLYGVYGVRQTASGWEVFTQREGRQDRDGVITGRPLVVGDGDLDPYLWSPIEWFAEVTLFVTAETAGGDDPSRRHPRG